MKLRDPGVGVFRVGLTCAMVARGCLLVSWR